MDGKCLHNTSSAGSFQSLQTIAAAAKVGLLQSSKMVFKTSGVRKASKGIGAGDWSSASFSDIEALEDYDTTISIDL